MPTAVLVASNTSVSFDGLDEIDGGTASVTITNQGQAPSGPLTITGTEGITVSGCDGTLAAGASCTLTIVVKPDASTGVFTGTVTIAAQPGTLTPLVIAVSSAGSLLVPFTVAPWQIDLGTVQMGIALPLVKITVSAKKNLTDLTLTATGPDVAIDWENTTCTAVLASGQNCIVAVKFLATTAGDAKDTVSILGGGRSASLVSVPITATVVALFLDGGVDVSLDGSATQSLDGGMDVPLDGNVAEPLDGGVNVGADAGEHRYRFAPEIVAKGCAKALACANGSAGFSQGLGQCVTDLTRNGALDLGRQTMLLAFIDDSDWLLQLALMQNMGCVQAASDCTAVLACLNQGQAQPACVPPAGYAMMRRCRDARHLRGCSFADSSTSVGGVEVTFDCGALGLECVETAIPWKDKILAGCAARVASPKPATETVTATCQGDEARFEFGNGAYTYDCSTSGATCVSGDYALMDDSFCVGKRATACGPTGFIKRCEGDTLIECVGGQEAAQDCSTWGATCGTPGISSIARCGFVCNLSPDSCTAGTVDYCGPNGMTSFPCASVGMTACQIDATYAPAKAWCVSP